EPRWLSFTAAISGAAEQERVRLSDRTKAGLQRIRAKGVRLERPESKNPSRTTSGAVSESYERSRSECLHSRCTPAPPPPPSLAVFYCLIIRPAMMFTPEGYASRSADQILMRGDKVAQRVVENAGFK